MTVELCVPGEAEVFGWRFRVEGKAGTNVVVRNWKPGDKVTLRYSSGRRKVKEVLERLKVTGEARSIWPVVEWMGQLVWMQGVEVQPVDGVVIRAEKLS